MSNLVLSMSSMVLLVFIDLVDCVVLEGDFL